MKGEIELSINRKGSFKVLPRQLIFNQCGRVKAIEYEYQVKIVATNKYLTKPSGFVVENGIIDRYFQETYVQNRRVCVSCEMMVCDAIAHFRDLFNKDPYRKVDLKRVKITIAGSNHSFIEGEWNKKLP